MSSKTLGEFVRSVRERFPSLPQSEKFDSMPPDRQVLAVVATALVMIVVSKLFVTSDPEQTIVSIAVGILTLLVTTEALARLDT